jgi:hypothetical protein
MPYDDLEQAQMRVLLDYLEARLIACEVWRARLNFMLDSPTVTPDERARALQQRDAALVEWGEVFTELEAVKAANPLA